MHLNHCVVTYSTYRLLRVWANSWKGQPLFEFTARLTGKPKFGLSLGRGMTRIRLQNWLNKGAGRD